MKTLKQLTEASKDDLSSIYCDMDEVLVALMDGAKQVLGKPFPEVDKTERWKTLSNVKNFWANLRWMPGAIRLYDHISKYDAHILSAYSSKDPNSQKGKMNWLQKNAKFPRSKIHLVKRAQKQAYAVTNGKPNVLIDDYIKNIKEWETKGGIGIHHTNVPKTINELKRLGFK
jgi:5'(3')-deoxyribonucleotidase